MSYRILMSGSSGFLGSALSLYFHNCGHEVTALIRSENNTNKPFVLWDPLKKQYLSSDFEGFDTIIHLAGENISTKRWSKKQKARLYSSRVDTTLLLTKILKDLKNPPKTFLTASATGFYGNRGNEILTEESSNGKSFLAHMCSAWEKASFCAKEMGTRVLHARFGMILGKNGGPLQKMLFPFRLFLGAKIATGKQYMSWIALEDAVLAIHYLLNNPLLKGPFNIVSPNPITNADFTKVLARQICKPAILTLPSVIIKLLFGKMGEEILLSSTRAIPKKLMDAGFVFTKANLEDALEGIR